MITSKDYKMTIMNHIEGIDHDQILILSLNHTNLNIKSRIKSVHII